MDIDSTQIIEIWRSLDRLNQFFMDNAKTPTPSIIPWEELNVTQIKVAMALAEKFPVPMKLKELAKELSLTPSAVSQVVDTLCAKGFLERETRENDRRALAISLTDLGKKLFSDINDKVSSSVQTALDAIPKEKLEAFEEVLHLLEGKTLAN